MTPAISDTEVAEQIRRLLREEVTLGWVDGRDRRMSGEHLYVRVWLGEWLVELRRYARNIGHVAYAEAPDERESDRADWLAATGRDPLDLLTRDESAAFLKLLETTA